MFLTYFLFLAIIATLSLIFSMSDLETPYIIHILGYVLPISIYLYIGYMCLFGRVVFNPQLFYQNIGIVGVTLVCLGTIVFVFMLFEYANMIKMNEELLEEKEDRK
jgi:SNF family Na+-dependent transporter